MKLQISFDQLDIDKSIDIAKKVEKYADILEVGSLLIYKYGDFAVKKFKETFPNKIILADAKIVDRAKDSINLFASAGADWITVLSGANKTVIQSASMVAHELGKKIMLDLLDSTSLGQSALEAKSLGVDAIVFHKPIVDGEQLSFMDKWEMVKGNTNLPVYIHAQITKENIADLLSLGAAGLIVTSLVSSAIDPEEEAANIYTIINGI